MGWLFFSQLHAPCSLPPSLVTINGLAHNELEPVSKPAVILSAAKPEVP
jgi:hypothetical protein